MRSTRRWEYWSFHVSSLDRFTWNFQRLQTQPQLHYHKLVTSSQIPTTTIPCYLSLCIYIYMSKDNDDDDDGDDDDDDVDERSALEDLSRAQKLHPH